ncbi:hypothetical protein N2152v2_002384 [Parachlorella kessleri]
MLGQSKSVSVATALLLCYSVGQIASTGWWLFQLSGKASCPLDNEGAWSIGIYKGTSPFSLQPLENHEPQERTPVAWPVANPVLTCASVGDVPSSFVADPFLWQHHSGLYLFYEVKNLAKGRGEIGVAQSTDGGATFKHLGVVLDEPWHLSYPFIFGYKGQIYMLPEASGSGQLQLYRAKSFPLHWVLDRVLLERPLVDASPVQWAGRWWMFASDPRRRSARNLGELEVWHADSPLGPWEEHALNPVVNGAPHLGARSGGRPLVYEGKLYRFGQDCGETYGHKLVAYEVTKLTPTEFKQEPARLALAGPASSIGDEDKLRWNSARQHHIDVQQLPSGEWVAAVDGDRVPSGAISRELLRCAGRALWPWLTLCAAWGALRLAARRSPAVRRWLLAGPAARLLGRSSKLGAKLGLLAQHKRDDSDDVEQQHGASDAKNGKGGSVTSIRIKADGAGLAYAAQQQQEAQGAGSWWGRGWGRVSQRRLRVGSPTLAGPLSPRSSFRQTTMLRRAPAWAIALAVASVAAACLAAVGGGLYVRPYVMPYQAIPVEGQFSQFTLVSMSYEARMPTLRHMVRHYSRCPSVGEIVLVWNKGRPPNPETDFDSAVPVRVRVEPLNSLNNRFKVDHLIRNRAVLSLDDDIIMPCGDIERGFAVWRQQPQKMVGFFPRLMEGSPLVFRGESYSIGRGLYNAVLTGAAFLDSWTAFPAYWADAVAPARATVDEVFNGEDLLMNFVLANRTHHLLAAAGASEVRRRRQEQEELRGQMMAGQHHQGQRRQQQHSLQRRRQQQQQHEEGKRQHEEEVDWLPDSAIEFIAPTRRVDISKLSGVGISRNFERFKQQAGHYLANFTATFGYMPLESLPHKWTEQSRPPFCAIGWLGCTYLN